jgi:hypothetical protein
MAAAKEEWHGGRVGSGAAEAEMPVPLGGGQAAAKEKDRRHHRLRRRRRCRHKRRHSDHHHDLHLYLLLRFRHRRFRRYRQGPPPQHLQLLSRSLRGELNGRKGKGPGISHGKPKKTQTPPAAYLRLGCVVLHSAAAWERSRLSHQQLRQTPPLRDKKTFPASAAVTFQAD